jgi:pilus assembly protein Flp/PilA
MFERPTPQRLARLAMKLARNRRGATSIEYGLILALIVLVMFVALANVAGTTIRMWTRVSNNVESAS